MTSHSDPKVILLTSPSSYRGMAFMRAAERLKLPVIQVFDLPEDLSERAPAGHSVNFRNIPDSARHLAALHAKEAVSAILSVDDSATELAAVASELAGLPANDPAAARAARDKFLMRSILSAQGVKCPGFVEFLANTNAKAAAAHVSYPCVVKARRLSGSRGVIRADDPGEFVAAFQRVAAIIGKDGEDLQQATILVEDYLPGVEVAVEGLVTDGELQVLAIFDKPDPLVGPFFEETIYVTPSRLSTVAQHNIAAETEAAARALGLRHGPIHAELRINNDAAWLLEVAGRSIGGLWATILEFGSGMSLEELILRHAVGLDIPSFERAGAASGVMMIPIPRGGILRGWAGVEEALTMPGIEGVEITAKKNYPIVPLPEGSSYLGFIFARGASPAEVEAAIREAHSKLEFRISNVISMTVGT